MARNRRRPPLITLTGPRAHHAHCSHLGLWTTLWYKNKPPLVEMLVNNNVQGSGHKHPRPGHTGLGAAVPGPKFQPPCSVHTRRAGHCRTPAQAGLQASLGGNPGH